MPVVSTWDFINRRIHMGVADYDPIDIYREHRAERATNESARVYRPLCKAIGGQGKGGGRRFGNALQLLDGAKIVPLDGSTVNIISGEIVTDDPDIDPDPFDSSALTGDRPLVELAPVSQILETSGNQTDYNPILNQIRALVSEINRNNP